MRSGRLAPGAARRRQAEDKVKRRLEVYHEQTEPLGDYFEQRGILRRFDGSRGATEVHDHVRASLATLRHGRAAP